MPSADDKDKKNDSTPPPESSPDDIIDHTTFDQLLEMDDDDNKEFSKEIVWNYFDQAEDTFKQMDEALEENKPEELSRLGHYLKGSSAAVGLKKVKTSCEKIQHYGSLKDETGTISIEEDEAMKKIRKLLVQVKEEYKEAEDYLKKFYEERA